MAPHWRKRLRCAVIYAAAYAIALQGLIFALQIGAAVAALQQSALGGFALCHHDEVAVILTDDPSQSLPSDRHCPFCVVGLVYVNSQPPSVPGWTEFVPAKAVQPLPAPRLAAFGANAGAWPRGPPITA